jgi:hypothetical protein
MVQNDPTSIADARGRTAASRVWWLLFGGLGLIGGAAAVWYASQGLTLSHYDARAHLVVARRVVDSLTPGWRQLGAVWLPLPHLINMAPAQWNWAFQTGAIAVVINVAALAWSLASFGEWLLRRTGSVPAALFAPLLLALNPNVLYLQSTPMTEPLLFSLSLAALVALDDWLHAPASGRRVLPASCLLAALVWTRYEGWIVAGALLVMASAIASYRRVRVPAGLWAAPVVAIAAFLVLGRASTGQWLQASGFFVADPELHRQLAAVIAKVRAGLLDLSGWPLLLAGGLGAAWVVARSPRSPERLLVLALLAASFLPFYAFYNGHPFRIRYLMPTVVGLGALAGWALAAVPRRGQWVAGAMLVTASLLAVPAWDAQAPMVREAQWETPFRHGREAVTAELRRVHDGTPILASMGSLGHYMQEASHAGFFLRDFLHEGNGDLWLEALRSPRRSVRWVLIEEQAEGGDVLAARRRLDPDFLAGFERIREGGGLALYRRAD